VHFGNNMCESCEIKHNPQKSFRMVTVHGGGPKNGLKWAELRDLSFFLLILCSSMAKRHF
jgi:hypothetical protein